MIDEVRLDGADAVDADALIGGLANRGPEGWLFVDFVRFDEISVELDRRRIETYYRERGYFGVRVEGPKVEAAEAPDHVRLVWTIDEGAVTRLVAVRLEGAPAGLEARLEAQIGLEIGAPFDHAEYRGVKPRLRAALIREGYARAEVEGTVRIHRPRGEAEVRLRLSPGPLVHLGRLTSVRGLTRTPTSAVRNRQTWQPGDVFSLAKLEQMRGRLYEIDQYAGVRLDYDESSDSETADIVATVEESSQNELQLGVGAGFDRANVQIRLRGRYKRRSFPLPLTNLAFEATPEYSLLRADLSQGRFTPQARLTWTWYDFAVARLELKSDVGVNFRQLEAFTWFGPDVGQTLSRPFLDDRLRVGVGWRFFSYGFSSDLSAADQASLGVDRTLPVLYFEPALTFDARDDALTPRSGLYARLAFEIGVGLRGGSGAYTVLSPELRGYLPLHERLVIAARARLGTTLNGNLPAPRRFFAGGAASQRGFSQRRLSSTLDITRDGERIAVPIGGTTLVETGLEARVRIVKLFGFWLGVVAFVDGADLVEDLGDVDPLGLHWAAGGGLRYYTPIGAVRVDVGVRLNRTGAPEPGDRWAWHLTLGEAF